MFEKFVEEKDALKNLQDLNGSKKIIILDKYLSVIENTPYNSRKDVKDPLLACFYFLNPDDEELFNYRRKLSSLLF